MSSRGCDVVPVERECLGLHPRAFYDMRRGWVFGHRGPVVRHALPFVPSGGWVWFCGPDSSQVVGVWECVQVYLCFRGCLRRYPRICAALMRHGYLTEVEAGWVVRDWREKRAARFSCDAERASSYWTELKAETLGGIIRRMRKLSREALAFNLAQVRAYLVAYGYDKKAN